MPEDQVFLQTRAAQVQIAIAQSRVFMGIDLVFDEEGRVFGTIQNLELEDLDLNLSCRDLFILHPLRPGLDLSMDGQHPLSAEFLAQLMDLGINFRIEDDLGDSLAVSEIDKDQSTMIAPRGDPAHEDDFFADVAFRERAAGVCPLHAGQFH